MRAQTISRTIGMKGPTGVGPAGVGAGLYPRWVFANAVGEDVGLGLTALIGGAAVLYAGGGTGLLPTLLLAVLTVLAGTLVEGTVVGTAQWLVLGRPLPSVGWRTWAIATGAFVAWSLCMVPSTALSPGEGGGRASAEPSPAVMLGLAFLMGLALGPVLGFAQWLALRRFVGRTWVWMPANAFAWAAGMVCIFAGVDPVTEGGGFGAGTALVLAATLVCAGAVVVGRARRRARCDAPFAGRTGK